MKRDSTESWGFGMPMVLILAVLMVTLYYFVKLLLSLAGLAVDLCLRAWRSPQRRKAWEAARRRFA